MNKLLSFLRMGFAGQFSFNNQAVINIGIVKFKYHEIKRPNFLTPAVDIWCPFIEFLT